MSNFNQHQEYLAAMGIVVWLSNKKDVLKNEHQDNIETQANRTDSSKQDYENLRWHELQSTITECQLCHLHRERKQAIVGNGDQNAKLFIITSNPSESEDQSGQLHINLEGGLIDNILGFLDLDRNEVYFSSIIKCKSNIEHDFSDNEMTQCVAYLDKQIKWVNPIAVLILDQQVAQYLFKTDNSLATIATTTYHYPDTNFPAFACQHAEKLLVSGAAKRDAWFNLIRLKAILYK